MSNRKIVIAAGSGFLGHLLVRAFEQAGDRVVVLSRHASADLPRTVVWDGATRSAAWTREIDGADVVINLTGRSVDCRYTPENRRTILESRVESTRAIGTAIAHAIVPPAVWLQMSTATIYAHSFDAPNDEFTGVIGGEEMNAPPEWRFSTDVAKAWEQAAGERPLPRTRVLKLRTAMVMGPRQGSAFDILLRLVRYGLGGRAGDGAQYVSWIHHRDFVRAVLWLIDHNEISGVVNLASPNPLTNAEFMRSLRDAWGRSFGLSSPQWLLEAGAALLRTETELVLKSRRVVPGRLLKNGFRFDFPAWDKAARNLCGEFQERRSQRDLRDVVITRVGGVSRY